MDKLLSYIRFLRLYYQSYNQGYIVFSVHSRMIESYTNCTIAPQKIIMIIIKIQKGYLKTSNVY